MYLRRVVEALIGSSHSVASGVESLVDSDVLLRRAFVAVAVPEQMRSVVVITVAVEKWDETEVAENKT